MTVVPYALITGGGTTVPVDAMRSMANGAEGDFALSFAHQFSRRGIPVVLILSRLAWLKHRTEIPAGAEVIQFTTFAQYQEALDQAVRTYGQPGYAMSTAAVSDYGFAQPVQGKIPSDQDMLALNLPRLPKVLDTWREKFGIKCFIVGFKLLSRANATLKDVLAAAHKQNKRARLNATVANLTEEIGGGFHPVWWVTPDGGVRRIEGHRDEVAREIVQVMVRYQHTHWHKSVRQPGHRFTSSFETATMDFAKNLLDFAIGARLLTNASGNLAVRAEDGLLVSPRGVDKKDLRVDHLVFARFHPDDPRQVQFWSHQDEKPSIDTAIHLHLSGDFPHMGSLHFHGGWVLGNVPSTRMSYPCGTLEQAMSIREALARYADANNGVLWDTHGCLMLELTNHGHILFFRDAEALTYLQDEFENMAWEYKRHMQEIGREDLFDCVELFPIFQGSGIAGVVARVWAREDWYSFFLTPVTRGSGLGQELVRLINERDVLVVAHDKCGVKEFYQARGFRTVERMEEDSLTVLQAPVHRDDLVMAATLCIHCTITDRVLLVERGSTSYPGYFAHVGGAVDPDDPSELATAIREGSEEVGADLTGLPEPDPQDVSVHYTGWVSPKTGEQRGYRVTNILVRVLVEFQTHPDGVEIVSAVWYNREDARKLKMGPATKEVLKKAWSDFR